MQTIATLAADPVASLVDTAFIGHLGQLGPLPDWTHLHPEQKQLASRNSYASAGAVQLAGVGIALSVYSTVTKLFNVPLLSVATSSVATAYGEHEGRHNPYLPEVSAHLSLLLMSMCKACDSNAHGGVSHAGLKAVQSGAGSHKEVSEAASAVLLLAVTVGVCEVCFDVRRVAPH